MPSLTKNIILFLVISITSFLFLFVSDVSAAPFNWENTYPFSGKGRFIKFSSAENNTVYVAIDHNGTFDLLKSTNNGQTWESIKGNLPGGSDITWITDFPGDKNTIAIGLWGTGFFITEDGGTTWQNIYYTISPKSIEISPFNANIIYIGLFNNQGVYKTLNKGVSWSKVNELGNVNVPQIKFDPSNNLRMFISTDPILYRTDDAGVTWKVLPLTKVFGDRIIVDRINSSIIYAMRYDLDEGIYKTDDDGESWVWKQNGPKGKVYQLAQDYNLDLFATRLFSSPNGGVWRSGDGAETWENVQDPSWGEANTWGIDAKNGTVVVNVEGLGIFVASNTGVTPTPTPTPTPSPTLTPIPGPNPIVVIPGFGGSFSTKGLILNQETTYKDWQMMPFQAPSIYNPFLNALSSLNYLRNNKVFFFAYDFTKSISVSGSWLNQYLENEVLSVNPGLKADIVGHSMGGLVARYCFESIPGCRVKINKIVTAGTPHKGAVADYPFWEGGDLSSLDPLSRFGAEIFLGIFGGGNKVQAIQLGLVGAKDFMPIYDYIINKPYSTLSSTGQNPVLKNLPLSQEFSSQTLALSGNKNKNTISEFSVKMPSARDVSRGIWIDGIPKAIHKGLGDGTVLEYSSNVPGAINKNYAIKHIDYLNSKQSVADILQFLGISPIGPIPFQEADKVAIYYSTDPSVEVNTSAEPGEEIVKPDPNVVFVKGPRQKQRKIDLKSNKNTDTTLKGLYYQTLGTTYQTKPLKIKLIKNILSQVSVKFY